MLVSALVEMADNKLSNLALTSAAERPWLSSNLEATFDISGTELFSKGYQIS